MDAGSLSVNNCIVYSFVMLAAGLGIPVMAALNGSLGMKLQNPVLAASILFAVGLVVTLMVLLVRGGFSSDFRSTQTPWYLYCGGLFICFYVFSITWVVPRFGVANAVAFVLLGQLIAMTIIDHFGLFGALKYPLTIQRLFGVISMAGGVFLVVQRS